MGVGDTGHPTDPGSILHKSPVPPTPDFVWSSLTSVVEA